MNNSIPLHQISAQLNLSLGALHVVANPSTSDEERAAIVKAALEGRVTATIAEYILDGLRNPPEPPEDSVERGDPLEPADPHELDDSLEPDDPIEPDEDDVGDGDPENCRTAFMLRADLSITAAKDAKQLVANYKSYSKVPDEAFVQLVDHVLHAWKELRDELSAGRGPIKSAADRAEARSRAVAT